MSDYDVGLIIQHEMLTHLEVTQPNRQNSLMDGYAKRNAEKRVGMLRYVKLKSVNARIGMRLWLLDVRWEKSWSLDVKLEVNESPKSDC